MNPIIPIPPPAPRVTALVTVPPASFSPTAVTAPPARPSIDPQQEPPRRKKPASRRWAYRAAALGAIGLTALAASMTEPGPKHPTIVSGRASPKVSDSGSPVRWWKSQVKITLDGSLADIGADAEDAVRGGFGTWLAHDDRLPKLRFDSSSARKAVTLTPDGENRVYFAPITIAGHENDLAITLAYTDPQSGEVVEADVVLNAKHAYGVLPSALPDGVKRGPGGPDGTGPAEGQATAALAGANVMAPGCKATYDVQSIVTHEIGHFFGLGEDTTDAAATMFFSTLPCDLGKRDLASGDASEMSSLYASGTLSAATESGEDGASAAAGCAVRGSARMAPSRAMPLGLGLAFAAGLIRRRRR